MSDSNQPPQDPNNPYGNEPPQPPSSGDPSQGQTPPPPPSYGQPDYGQPQTPPPYGQQPAQGQNRPFSVGEAFNYGWTKFQANVGPIILAVIGIIVVTFVVQIIGWVISGALAGSSASTLEYDPLTGQFERTGGSAGLFGASLFVSAIFGFISYALTLIIQSGIIKGSLAITYGRKIDFKEMFSGLNFVQIIIASIIVGLATFVGLLLCFVPGLVVMFFTWFTLYFVVDKNMPALEAIKASVSFVNKNMGTLIGFFLAALVAYFVGALLCGIGLLVAIPVVIIAQAYTYRTLQGESVAA